MVDLNAARWRHAFHCGDTQARKPDGAATPGGGSGE